jgi:hypothetical protein
MADTAVQLPEAIECPLCLGTVSRYRQAVGLHFDCAGGFTDPEGIRVVPPPISRTFPLVDLRKRSK